MKRIDRLIINELVGPWLFGVAMFSMLIFATTFLFKATDYIVSGISPGVVTEMMLLFLPGVIVKTFPMAVLLAGLLGFGRLSSDSEVTALRAAGVSIGRLMRPVAIFSTAIALCAFLVNEAVVPAASQRFLVLKDDIQRNLDARFTQSVSRPIIRDGKLVGTVMAKDFRLHDRTLTGASIVSYDEKGGPTSWLYVNKLQFSEKDFISGRGGWRIIGGGQLLAADGTSRLVINDQVWPSSVSPLTASPGELVSATTGDQFDSYSMAHLRDYIESQRQNKDVKPAQIWNWEFVYWNKIGLPFAAVIYGLLGAPLGIRNQRTGAATGFSLAIGIIFAYFELVNFMNIWAQGGRIPPYLASFTPLAIGLLCSGVIMWRRNK